MKTQMRFQKILILVSLIVAALTFVYALSFCGGTVYQYGTLYDQVNDIEKVLGAKDLFIASQKYNDVLLWLSIVFILVVIVNYVMASQRRRNYYVTNYISIILTVVYAVAFAAVLAWIVTDTFGLFTAIDKEMAEIAFLGTEGFSYSIVNFILGYAMAGVVVIDAALLIFNLVWKVQLMKGEKKLLAMTPEKVEQVTEEAV